MYESHCQTYFLHMSRKKINKRWFLIKMSEVRIQIGKIVKGLDILLKFILLNDFLRNLAINSTTPIWLHWSKLPNRCSKKCAINEKIFETLVTFNDNF
jgi:hypothetical protein